jgi:hypothetical protein
MVGPEHQPAGSFRIGHGFSGICKFGKNKTAAKERNVYRSQRALFEERCRTVEGFDLTGCSPTTRPVVAREQAIGTAV